MREKKRKRERKMEDMKKEREGQTHREYSKEEEK